MATPPSDGRETLALMLGGGGARGAYQAGVLRGIARLFPSLSFPILTGISAGAINTLQLASCEENLAGTAARLVDIWRSLTPERVYDVRSASLVRNALRWGARLVSGGFDAHREPMRGMVDPEPLRRLLYSAIEHAPDGSLPGIARNIARGRLHAVAVSATSYESGQSVTWVEGQDVSLWQRPQRRTEAMRLTIEHAMASSALPMFFPAVQIGGEWFGDGGIRLTAPLSPALHLGATRILTISTRRRPLSANELASHRYPPPAQVLGTLYNSVFLDLIDEDILRLKRVNRLLKECPPDKREGMRSVGIMVIRPSMDLRTLARKVEPRLPTLFRYLTRGLGTRQAASPDLLSLVLFEPEYISRLIKLGEADAEANARRLELFLRDVIVRDTPARNAGRVVCARS